jgi:hypothetical protein
MSEIKKADSKGRVTIPSLANETLVIEQIGDSEFRVRVASTVPIHDLSFPEDRPGVLADKDVEKLVDILDNPPEPNRAAKKAAKEYKEYLKRHGRSVDDRKAREKTRSSRVSVRKRPA